MRDRGDSVFATVWGPVGSVVAALCCLGAAPLLAALTAAGLGFLINDLFLVPLLAAFLGVTIWGLRRDAGRHGSGGPAGLAWLAALVTVGGAVGARRRRRAGLAAARRRFRVELATGAGSTGQGRRMTMERGERHPVRGSAAGHERSEGRRPRGEAATPIPEGGGLDPVPCYRV